MPVATRDQKTRFPGSPDLDPVASRDGETWGTVRTELHPNYRMVWIEIGFAYAMIVSGFTAMCALNAYFGNWPALIAVPFVAVWIGYWLVSLGGFIHEAAHFNLARDPGTNDLLAAWFVYPLYPLDVKAYRKSHWSHHLHLGDPEDTEISYHNRPTLGLLLQSVTGIYSLRVLLRYASGPPSKNVETPKRSSNNQSKALVAFLRAATLHGAIVIGTAWAGWYAAALCWVVAQLTINQTLAMIRQMLEHRSADALDGVDYRQVSHGPINRMFGVDFLSRKFGSAGFNRHLLHHWDPTISYTCFDEMERFFLKTDLADEIESSRTTYLQALRSLMKNRDG